jgi:hypothetical protein
MDGRAHFRKAEQFAEKASEYLGHGDGQDTAAVWAAVAQVHATLAVAAGLEPEPEPARPITSGLITDDDKAETKRRQERDRAARGPDQDTDIDPL